MMCHAELVYATRAFALRKLFNASLACLGHQHLFDIKKFVKKFSVSVMKKVSEFLKILTDF